MAEEREFVSLTKELYSTIQKHGVKGAVRKLKQINNNSLPDGYEQKLVNFIVKECSKAYSVHPEDLKKKYVRDGEHEARTIAIILIKRYVKIGHRETAKIFDIANHGLVTFALNELKKKDRSIAPDRAFLRKLEEVDSVTAMYKEKLLEKHG